MVHCLILVCLVRAGPPPSLLHLHGVHEVWMAISRKSTSSKAWNLESIQ